LDSLAGINLVYLLEWNLFSEEEGVFQLWAPGNFNEGNGGDVEVVVRWVNAGFLAGHLKPE